MLVNRICWRIEDPGEQRIMENRECWRIDDPGK
jgi:hypothetical protein